MNKAEVKVSILAIIDNADGSVTADEIYNQLRKRVDPGRTQETIRKYIREMVSEQSNLIGSSNRGYFKINTPEKARKAISYLLSRIPDLQQRADNLKEVWNVNNPQNGI
jgi:repressor of nif and glnA expression